MKQKKKLIAVLSVSVGALVVGLIVWAFFTAADQKTNSITPGENILQISEDYVPIARQEQGDNVYKKEVRIVNQGNTDCYIRVYADFSDSGVRDRSYLSNDPAAADDSFYSALRSTTGDTYIAHLSEVAPHWAFVPDDSGDKMAGYYYYTEPVPAGASTDSLFTYVKTNNATDEEIQQYDIMLYSESIQTTDIDGETYTGYTQAWTDVLNRS